MGGPGSGRKPGSGKTKKEMDKGLKGLVDSYKETRKYGNVKLAKKIKRQIDSVIKNKGLNSTSVYGTYKSVKG
jgi:hypothetical protein